MALQALTVTDDDGSGTTGDVANNAWLQTLLDTIDGRWSEITTTATGSQNNLSITSSSIEADVLRCNNASDLTITGIAAPASPAKPGKKLIIYSVGAGNVFLSHQSGSSSAGNRLINIATSGLTPLAAGVGVAVLVYDATVTDGRWRLVAHDQGAWITPTFAAGNFTASGAGTWTVGSGDVTTQKYCLRGRTLFVETSLATTTVARSGGDPTSLRISNAQWGGFTVANTQLMPAVVNDNAAGTAFGVASISASGTSIAYFLAATAQWANATDATGINASLAFEVV